MKVMKIIRILFLFTLFLFFISCMSGSGEINPVRKRVISSLNDDLGGPADITIGSTQYSFAVCADTHIGDKEEELFDKILKSSTSGGDKFLIVVGDITNWGKKSQYEVFKNHIGKYTYPHGIFSAIGNHDVFGNGWKN